MHPDLSVLAGPEPTDPSVIRLDLNIGANSPVLSEEQIRKCFEGLRHYGHPTADPLRLELAQMLNSHHRVPVSLAHVAVGAGSMALLREAVIDAVAANSPVVTFQPGYAAMRRLSQALGADVVSLPRTKTGGIPVQHAVASVGDAKAPLIVLNHPINPTGLPEEVEAVNVLRATLPQAVVLIDEAYWEYTALPSALDIADTVDRLVVVRTFSKARGLAGIRLGYGVTDADRVKMWMNRIHPGSISSVTQMLGVYALMESESALAHRVAETMHERERLTDSIRNAWRIEPLSSQANFLFVPLGPRARSVWAGLREQGIWVRLIENEPGVSDGIRVSVGSPADNEAFIDALGDVKRFIE